MELVTIIVLIVVLFLGFLMLTSGRRKHRLEKALGDLGKERMRLLKSIEHVKISFYQKKLDEKDAQDKIFGLEEKLRGIESRILDIKEKPMMRTLKKHEDIKDETFSVGGGMGEEGGIKAEEAGVTRAERVIIGNLGAKTILLLIILIAVGIIAAIAFSSAGPEVVEEKNIVLPLKAYTVPTESTHPGSNAQLRVEIENDYEEDLKYIRVIAKSPQGSGINFEFGESDLQILDELEMGGLRELYFPIHIDSEADEGVYVLQVEARNDVGLNSTTSTKLTVRVGAE